MRQKLPRVITQKVYKHDLWILHSPRRLLLIDSHMKFHRDILNGFQVIERTRFNDKHPREVIKKESLQKLWFVRTKNRIRFTEMTRFCDRHNSK